MCMHVCVHACCIRRGHRMTCVCMCVHACCIWRGHRMTCVCMHAVRVEVTGWHLYALCVCMPVVHVEVTGWLYGASSLLPWKSSGDLGAVSKDCLLLGYLTSPLMPTFKGIAFRWLHVRGSDPRHPLWCYELVLSLNRQSVALGEIYSTHDFISESDHYQGDPSETVSVLTVPTVARPKFPRMAKMSLLL